MQRRVPLLPLAEFVKSSAQQEMASGFGLDTDSPVLKGDEELKQSVLKNFAASQRNTYCLQIIFLHKRG